MAEKDNIYGSFGDVYGGLGKVLPFLADTLPKYPASLGANILGGGTDILGILSENIGQDELARKLRANAQNLYNLGGEFLRGDNIFETAERLDREKRLNTLERIFNEGKLVDPDKMMLFEPPDPVSDLGERLSRLGNLSATSPKVPPEGRPQTIPEEKEESVADLQEEVKADEQLFGREKEAFRKEEEGRLQGTPTTPENIDQINEDAFKSAMEDFMNKAGKGKATKGAGAGGGRSLEDYKKEFAKATGINIEGGPDKSNFLMALGLGLMQNRAGKNFDISKILTSVGEATEKAMPKLEEAQKQYAANKLAAGKYAIQAKAKDAATAAAAQKKLNETKGYFIVPTGGKAGLSAGEYLGNAENGRYMKLSNAQIAQLEANPEFNQNFSVLPGEMWGDIVKESIEAQQKGGIKYLEKVTNVPMFAGAEGDYFNIPIQYVDQNTVPEGQTASPKFAGSEKNALNKLQELKSSADRSEKQFKDIAEQLNRTDIRFQDQIAQVGIQILRGFGIKDTGGETAPIKQLDYMLTKLQAEEASNILQEAGKTLSDKDREMVKLIVGSIDFASADKELLVQKISNLYGRIVGAKRRNLQQGAQALYSYGVTGAAEFIDPDSAAFGVSATSTSPNFTYTTMPNGRLRLSLIGN